MALPHTSEAELPFDAPHAAKPCVTFVKIVGDLSTTSQTPLITIHGGPGAGHEYLLPLADLHEKYGIPVIFYDQLGCGRSTRLREKAGDETFWTLDLFIRELDNLIDSLGLRSRGFHLFGHSFGGVLASTFAARRPAGLRKLILANAPSSIPLLIKGAMALLDRLPKEVKAVLEESARTNDCESNAYKQARMVLYKRHWCRLDPWPEQVESALLHLEEDPTAYRTMTGHSELNVTGSLRDWVGWSDAKNINVDTLILKGHYDLVQDNTVEPWFQTIPKVKSIQFSNSSHMCHVEERDLFMRFCSAFLGRPNGQSGPA